MLTEQQLAAWGRKRRNAARMRQVVKTLVRKGQAGQGKRTGIQSRVAEHFGVSRQCINMLVRQEQELLDRHRRLPHDCPNEEQAPATRVV